MAGNEQHSWISLTSPDGALEWASAYFSGLAFSPHRHDTYAVGFTTRGVQCFTYRGAARNACPGDVFVLHPDELHDGRQGTDDGYGYCIAYIEPALIGEALDGTSLPFVTEAVNRDHRLKSAITEMFPDSQDANNDLHHAGAVTTLADALNRLAGEPARSRKTRNAAGMYRVRDHLLAQLPSAIPIAELEAEHGIDRYSLSRQFRAVFGISPHRFITLRRLDIAKREIHRGRSLAGAAYRAGFADQSHLTRQFRSAFGLSPGVWQSLLAGKPTSADGLTRADRRGSDYRPDR